MLSPTLTKNPPSYANQIQSLANEANALCVKEESEYTERDVFVAMDLLQRYIEILDELFDSVHVDEDESVFVTVDGKVTLKLKSVEVLADWISNGNQEP